MNFLLDLVGNLFGISMAYAIIIFSYPIFLDIPYYLFPDILTMFREFFRRNFGKEFEVSETGKKSLVSILIPAYNAESTIRLTLDSLLESTYPNKEIILIDDGSTDGTPIIANEYMSQKKIDYVRSENRLGKAASLNMGYRLSHGEFIAVLDADTPLLYVNAINNLMKYFKDPKVIAVCGNLLVLNKDDNLLTKLQQVEYLSDLTVGRTFSHYLNTLMIVSAYGGFRREIIDEIGGWDPGIVEDLDTTLKVRKLRKKVAFAYDSIALTIAPNTLKKVFAQRLRWDKGNIRMKFIKHTKHGNLLDITKFGWRNFLPIILSYLFTIALNFLFFIYLIYIILNFQQLILGIIVGWILIYSLIECVSIGVSSYLIKDSSQLRNLIYTPAMFFYRIFLRFSRLVGFLEEFFGLRYMVDFYPEDTWNHLGIFRFDNLSRVIMALMTFILVIISYVFLRVVIYILT